MDKNQEKTPDIGVILLAAGSSTRMDGQDKIFMPIYNNPLLYYSLKEFNDSRHVSAISIFSRVRWLMLLLDPSVGNGHGLN